MEVKGFAFGCVKEGNGPLQMIFENKGLDVETVLTIVRIWLREQEDTYYKQFVK